MQALLRNMVSAHIRSRTSSIQEASSLQLATAQAYQQYREHVAQSDSRRGTP